MIVYVFILTVRWAHEAEVHLVSVSPRFFRKGPFNLPELWIVRVAAREKDRLRGGWLVIYRSELHNPQIHWDAEEEITKD